ncbi:RNA polymerase sigma factor [Streptomyces sp. PAN_FS17]|uniref:RNA polymerase sigma factor n=1 Tax=Streptomyces sp. PAN_FS17 TaxID=1855351 RepID=UPI000898F9AC|nr:RNA polymerase sigma factor [Streptomyces sp. PAN_FS17]SEB86106.1 RNA polymerase sigma-70 factor, ECF subfamily [Streptomyces sp. PAN_FS17]
MELSLRARIRAGDAQAFAWLFRTHAQAVHGHAARWLGDPNAAEDVVSLTFLEAWRLRERLLSDSEFTAQAGVEGEPDDGLRAWLFGISANVLRNTRRAARRHRAALDRLPDRRTDAGAVPDFADALVGRMEDAERLRAARAALRKLRPREREVFALCVWSQLSYADAATALQVPVSTVRSRLSRARQRLRRLAEAELARLPAPPSARPAEEKARRLPGGGQDPVDRTDAVRSTQERRR